MKKFLIIFAVLVIGAILYTNIPLQYTPLHQQEDVSKIELLTLDLEKDSLEERISVDGILSLESYADFWNDLMSLDCYRSIGDPSTEIGKVAVRITYKNGDVEIIGEWNSLYIVDGKRDYGKLSFKSEPFHAFYLKYANGNP